MLNARGSCRVRLEAAGATLSATWCDEDISHCVWHT
jgi:hypothetical protein